MLKACFSGRDRIPFDPSILSRQKKGWKRISDFFFLKEMVNKGENAHSDGDNNLIINFFALLFDFALLWADKMGRALILPQTTKHAKQ